MTGGGILMQRFVQELSSEPAHPPHQKDTAPTSIMITVSPAPPEGGIHFPSVSPPKQAKRRTLTVKKLKAKVSNPALDASAAAARLTDAMNRAPQPSAPAGGVARATSTTKGKSGKINAVSKASLAMLDPRHAMGMDAHDSPTMWTSKSDSPSPPSAGAPSPWKLTSSPTPELEAFTTTESYSTPKVHFDDSPRLLSASPEALVASVASMTDDVRATLMRRAASFDVAERERSVWDEDEDAAPLPMQSGGAAAVAHQPRETMSSDTARTARPSDYTEARRSKAKDSTISRLFSWKKGSSTKPKVSSPLHSGGDLPPPHSAPVRPPHPSQLTHSASAPVSAPAAFSTFEERYGALSIAQPLLPSDSYHSAVYYGSNAQHYDQQQSHAVASPVDAVRTSPPANERQPRRPSIPDTYKVHPKSSSNGVTLRDARGQLRKQRSGAEMMSLYSSDGFLSRTNSTATTVSTSSHVLSDSESSESFASAARPVSRVVQSINRGVPARAAGARARDGGAPQRSRIQSVYIPEDAGSPALPALEFGSMWGRADEPPVPALPEVQQGERAMRRRSRSVGSVMQTAVRPAGAARSAINTTPKLDQVASFRSEGGRASSFSTTEGKTVQARRVNLKQKSAKAVSVPSPALGGKSPRKSPGKSPTGKSPRLVAPRPQINVMPPTPDVGAETPIADKGAFEGSTPRVRDDGPAAQQPELVQRRKRENSFSVEVSHMPDEFTRAWSPTETSPVQVRPLDFGAQQHGVVVVDREPWQRHAGKMAEAQRRQREPTADSDFSEVPSDASTVNPFGFSRTMSCSSLSSSSSSSGASFSPMSSTTKLVDDSPPPASLATDKSSSDEADTSVTLTVATSKRSSLSSALTTSSSILDFGREDAQLYQAGILQAGATGLLMPFQMREKREEVEDCETPKLGSRSPPTVSEHRSKSGGPQLDFRLSTTGLGLGLGLDEPLQDVPPVNVPIPVTAALSIKKYAVKPSGSVTVTPPPVKPPKSQARLAGKQEPSPPPRAVSPAQAQAMDVQRQLREVGLGLGLHDMDEALGSATAAADDNDDDIYGGLCESSTRPSWDGLPRSESTEWTMGVAM